MPSHFSQNVSLTPELQHFIAEKVKSGRYRSASEVVRHALRCLEREDSAPHVGKSEGIRNDAELALRESEERLRSLTANMPSAMVYQIVASDNGERRFSFVAESCERLNGIKADHVVDNPLLLYEMILPEHREAFGAAEDEALQTKRPFDIEVAMRRADGAIRWHRISSGPRPGLGRDVIWDGIQVDITERVEAEAARSQAVARNEQLAAEMAAVLSQLAEGVIVTDREGKLIFVNGAASRIHGQAKLDIAPNNYSAAYQLFTEDGHPYPPHELPLARAVLNGETVTEARWRIRRPDGTEVLAIGTAGPVFRPDGSRMGAVLTLRDDTARHAGESQLQRSEALKGAILEAALDCIVTVTDNSTVVEWNPAAERTFGFARDAVLGQDLAQLIIPPEFRDRHYEGMARYLTTGEGPVLRQRIELEALRADGSRFPVELAISPIGIDGRQYFTAYLRDISERKRTEAALRDSEQRLRATYEHAFVGIAEVDLNGRFLRVNEEFISITGVGREELLNRTFADITHIDDQALDLERFRRQMAGEIKDYAAEKRYVHKDGHTVWVELYASRVDDQEGHPLYGVRVVRDISERKRAEQHRELLINELNHRVKNTLATVQSIASQTLRNAETMREAKTGLEARLFALARVHDVLTEESWAGANLSDIVAKAVSPFQDKDAARFRCHGPQVRLPPRMALALAMALQELATNAVKYGALSTAGGEVSITWDINKSARLRLRWVESGGPAVLAPTRSGFGTRLIERGLAEELEGDVKLHFAPAGLVCNIEASLPPEGQGSR
jgi:putative addiction module CopG family antidote